MIRGKEFLGMILFWLFFSVSVCVTIHAAPVDPLKAGKVAQNLLTERSGYPSVFTNPAIVATEKIDNQPIYYIINFPKGGWAIVSADDVAYPIIAYSYTGSYSPDTPKSPEYESWMKNIGEEIYSAVRKKISPLPKTGIEWNRLNVDTAVFHPLSGVSRDNAVAPLIITIWNQGQYYNELCPADGSGPAGHALTGCVATAMAQVMKYHNYPATGVGNHSYSHPTYGTLSADFSATTYDWSSMPSSLLTYNTATATLMYHAGVAVDMNYGPTASGANVSVDTVNAFKSYFGYSDSTHYKNRSTYTTGEWQGFLRNELDNHRPVLYRGTGAQGGHAFVCDGYDAGFDYFHFNWGWGGYQDGNFYLDALTPAGNDFNSGQGGIFGIAPIAASLSYPYSQGFESGVPSEWVLVGYRAALSSADLHSGASSVLLGSTDESGYFNEGNLVLYINAPVQGATLSFWVKRGYSPTSSSYNQQLALLESKFGDSVLHTFYDGDYNDAAWQQFSLDLSPWAGTTVKLFFQQYNSSGSYSQWTYVDDVSITLNPVADCGGEPDGTLCDDGSACTTPDVCSGGICGGTALVCNDSNGCTDDSCNPASGCVNVCSATGKNDSCCSSQVCSNTAVCTFSWFMFLPAITNKAQQ